MHRLWQRDPGTSVVLFAVWDAWGNLAHVPTDVPGVQFWTTMRIACRRAWLLEPCLIWFLRRIGIASLIVDGLKDKLAKLKVRFLGINHQIVFLSSVIGGQDWLDKAEKFGEAAMLRMTFLWVICSSIIPPSATTWFGIPDLFALFLVMLQMQFTAFKQSCDDNSGEDEGK